MSFNDSSNPIVSDEMSPLSDKPKKPEEKEQPVEESEILQKSTAGVSLLISVQFVTKLFTFVLNQLLIRYVSPSVFAISIYLEFLVSTVLFFSREGERLAVQRTENSKSDRSSEQNKGLKYRTNSRAGTLQSIINFGFIPLIISVPISAAIFYWQYSTSQVFDSVVQLPFYTLTLSLVGTSIFFELASEPAYAINQFQLNFGRRSQFESTAVFNRCLFTFGSVYVSASVLRLQGKTFDGAAVLAYAFGQFAYSFTLFVCYIFNFNKENNKRSAEERLTFSIQKINQTKNIYYFFDSKILGIWKGLFVQMLFKQVLTEGDKLLMNYLCTLEDQAVYSIITNYGSLIARLLFQPIEESMRLLFTRTLSSSSPSESALKDSYRTLSLLSIFYFNLSLMIMLAGFTNSSFLLKLIFGWSSKWKDTSIFEVFPQYTIYIPFLAFNGILEAFFSSIASNKDIRNFSIYMTISTAIFLVSSYIFIVHGGLGLTGLILANIVNMSLRISYCYFAISSYYNKHKIAHATVSILKYSSAGIIVTVLFEAIQLLVLSDGSSAYTTTFIGLVKSFLNCLACLLMLSYLERHNLKGFISQAQQRFSKKKVE
ncbi:hypothetical protein G9P44_006142 [Scheffersomyces stipitis]|nr:hypothetical protein G9P44_006142 [Scheffersomyces stipitis]